MDSNCPERNCNDQHHHSSCSSDDNAVVILRDKNLTKPSANNLSSDTTTSQNRRQLFLIKSYSFIEKFDRTDLSVHQKQSPHDGNGIFVVDASNSCDVLKIMPRKSVEAKCIRKVSAPERPVSVPTSGLKRESFIRQSFNSIRRGLYRTTKNFNSSSSSGSEKSNSKEKLSFDDAGKSVCADDRLAKKSLKSVKGIKNLDISVNEKYAIAEPNDIYSFDRNSNYSSTSSSIGRYVE